ncbi:MAG: ABC transporter substrate-binding protein [Deltaproteobacteria bacterium]|nr:ABC transporter substrate-binding protein [Deltaproteobacteria bacterium]
MTTLCLTFAPRIGGLIVIAARLIVLAACLQACRPSPKPPGSIVVLTESPITRLDPRFALGAWEVRVSRLVAPGLTMPGYAPGEAGLAEHVNFVDASHVEVALRPDARFSSGRPVTAADVAFTFTSVLDPALQSPYRAALAETLEAVQVLDERRVLFVLKVPRASFTADLQMGIVDRLAGGASVIGAGPFMSKNLATDRVELVANPFAAMRPKLSLIVRTIRDDNARIIALLGRSGDVILNGITPQVLPSLQAHQDLRITTAPSATITYLGFNLSDPLLSNPKVRRAIALAINKDELIASRLANQAAAADSLLSTDNPFYSPSPQLHFDPARAKRLLDEAGFPDPDGAGPAARFSLVWKSSNNRFRMSVAEAIAQQLKDVGIVVHVRAYEFATLMQDLRRGNYQLFSLQLTDVYEPDWLRSTFHSTRIPTQGNGWSGLNRFGFADPQVDALLVAASSSLDFETRRRLYAEVQARVAEALPCVPLWHEHNVLVTSRSLFAVPPPRTGGLEVLLQAQMLPPGPQSR